MAFTVSWLLRACAGKPSWPMCCKGIDEMPNGIALGLTKRMGYSGKLATRKG